MRQANSVGVMVCGDPKCRGVHIELLGDNDVAFAGAVIRIENIKALIEDIQNAAYKIAVEKG